MATITIENVPDSVVKIHWTKLRYSRDFVFPNKSKKSENLSLKEYINGNEYKNDEWEIFFTANDFLADLKKYKN